MGSPENRTRKLNLKTQLIIKTLAKEEKSKISKPKHTNYYEQFRLKDLEL